VLDAIMLTASALGHPNRYPFYLAFALWCSWRWPARLAPGNVVVFAVGFVLVSALLVPMLKAGLDLTRPMAALGASGVTLVGEPETSPAFPSGHAAFAVLAAAALAPGTARAVRAVLLLFTIGVCLSRISVGAHFPADVLGAALLSLAVVKALRAAFRVESPR
jgi:membrane-associated phospholipid phosphatase